MATIAVQQAPQHLQCRRQHCAALCWSICQGTKLQAVLGCLHCTLTAAVCLAALLAWPAVLSPKGMACVAAIQWWHYCPAQPAAHRQSRACAAAGSHRVVQLNGFAHHIRRPLPEEGAALHVSDHPGHQHVLQQGRGGAATACVLPLRASGGCRSAAQQCTAQAAASAPALPDLQ